MKVTFLIAENCFPSGIANLVDTFTIANLWQQKLTGRDEQLFATELVSVDGGPVTSSGCIRFVAQKSIAQTADAEYIVIPPIIPSPKLGSELTKEIGDWLEARHRADIPIAAICTGSFMLAETGLLDGRLATTNWQFARRFRQKFPEVRLRPEEILTEEDGLTCTGAATASFNLGLTLIERYGSKELAGICARALLVDPNRTSQAPYILDRDLKNHPDATIVKAQRFMEDRYAAINSVEEIAAHVSMSSRHFKRRFKSATGSSPLTYLQNLRIELAKKKLEQTFDSIDDITREIGYENSSTFRRLFKRRTSLSPREYRDKFAKKR